MKQKHKPLSRRDALKRLGVAGAGVFLTKSIIRGRSQDIVVAGSPVEIGIFALSPFTVRLTVQPIHKGSAAAIPEDGALGNEGEGLRLARRRECENFKPVSSNIQS